MSHRSRPRAKIVLFFAQITVFVGEKGRFLFKKGFWGGRPRGSERPLRLWPGLFRRLYPEFPHLPVNHRVGIVRVNQGRLDVGVP